jgi:hypothetical protein
MLNAYIAHAMTNRPGSELWNESTITEIILGRHGITTIDPVIEENIPNTDDVIPNKPGADGLIAWNNDKRAIRRSHVVIDITPESKSEGVLRELGYARFFLWKPVIRVYRPGSSPHMITVFEDDVIAYSLEEAAQIINERWGTWKKRFVWKLGILKRSLPKFIKYQIGELK